MFNNDTAKTTRKTNGEDNLQDPGDKARHKESNKPQVEESETADGTSQQLP